jgi:hypothetical protein
MTRRHKIFAGLAALAVVAVGIIVVARSRKAEVTLTFTGFSTNRAATFVLSNHSDKRLTLYGPWFRTREGKDTRVPTNGTTHFSRSVIPPHTNQVITLSVPEETAWQAVAWYPRTPSIIDKARMALTAAGFTLNPPKPGESVTSEVITNAPPLP